MGISIIQVAPTTRRRSGTVIKKVSEIFLMQMLIFSDKGMGLPLKFRAFKVQFSYSIQIFGWP